MAYSVDVRVQAGHELTRAGRYHRNAGSQQRFVSESTDHRENAVRSPRENEEKTDRDRSLQKLNRTRD